MSNNTIDRNARLEVGGHERGRVVQGGVPQQGGGPAATYFDYPTSSNTAPGRDMADVSGNNANYYGEPYPIDAGNYTTLVGEFQNSDSPYGTFDQGGNVWEWNGYA